MRNLLVIYEGRDWENYGSLATLRPVYCLRTGMTALWQPLKRSFSDYDLGFVVRESLEHVSLAQTGVAPNRFSFEGYDRIIFIDGSVRLDSVSLEGIQQAESSAYYCYGGHVLGIVLVPGQIERANEVASVLTSILADDASDKSLSSELEALELDSTEVKAGRYEYLWDLMLSSPDNISKDFEGAMSDIGSMIEHNLAGRLQDSKVIGAGDIFIHPTATVLPGVVFDSSSGPIYIDEETFIESGTYIVGPFYAGANCKLLGGKLAGSSLGPVCQVSGELEESVLQGYVNKHHAGFIGHSYVGEWVNFGAMTTNSDLKNNYSNVRVALGDEMIDTGSNKVGSFIGDHSKFGIGTLLNTGINIGGFCNVFGGGLIADKLVPSFSWGASGAWQKHDIDKALQTTERVMARRGQSLSEKDIALIRLISESKG